ncbi:MAG: hypothetical protein R3F65_29935 [bacterium]
MNGIIAEALASDFGVIRVGPDPSRATSDERIIGESLASDFGVI